MPRLIWVFAGRTTTLLVLSRRGSFIHLFMKTFIFIWFCWYSKGNFPSHDYPYKTHTSCLQWLNTGNLKNFSFLRIQCLWVYLYISRSICHFRKLIAPWENYLLLVYRHWIFHAVIIVKKNGQSLISNAKNVCASITHERSMAFAAEIRCASLVKCLTQ